MAQLYCWFSQLLHKKGQNYISEGLLTDQEVQRNLDRIVNDIVNGKIDYSQYGAYMLQPVIFDNLLSYCRNKAAMLSAELYCLSYTMYCIDIGQIATANTNILQNQFNPENAQYMDPHTPDYMALMSGKSTVSTSMRNTISAEYRTACTEYSKYCILRDVLEHIQESRNVYELQWVTANLKQYIRANNNLVY